jgi:AraC-like DNA-binding protein
VTGTLGNRLLLRRKFDSFEELAALARHWSADFRQLSGSETCHEVLQVVMDGVLMSRGRFGCHVQQYGNTPPGSRTFALLENDCPPVHWFGRLVSPGDLMIFPAGGEIDAVNRPGFHVQTFCVVMDELGDFLERAKRVAVKFPGPDPTVIPLPYEYHQKLQRHLRQVSFDPRVLERSLTLYDAYRDRLFELLVDLFSEQVGTALHSGARVRKDLISRVIAMVETSRDERFSVSTWSAHAGVPERTLRAVFRRELGMSPASFAKGYRLSRVHRDLWHARPNRSRVSDIANAWGFWHMGQFADDYRKQFGELPNQTLARRPSR